MAKFFGVDLPNIPFRIFIVAHFALLMLSGLTALPIQYHLMNYFVLILGLWMVSDKANSEASLFFIVLNALTIVGDIMLMILFHNLLSYSGNAKFGTFMAVCNLLLKPLTTVYAFDEHKRRQGDNDMGGYTNFDNDVAPTYLPGHISPPSPRGDL